jgi:phosphatidate cytidylyltransferase
MSNFWQRTITGFVFVFAIIGGVWLHPLVYLLVFLSVIAVGMVEFCTIIRGLQVQVKTGWALAIGLGIHMVSFFIFYLHLPHYWLLVLVPLVIGVFVSELYVKSKTTLLDIASTLLVPLYVAVPFAFLHFLAFHNGEYGWRLILGFFLMAWINDSGAYVTGSLFGRHKLFPRISPAKSWEGAVGGFVFTLLMAWANFELWGVLDLSNWLVMGALVSVMGTYGDLVESMLKRSVNVKDSGRLLPGHGGVLDRFDAIFFSAPVVSGYLLLC